MIAYVDRLYSEAAYRVGVPVAMVRGSERTRLAVTARRAVWYVLREERGWSLSDVASVANRDHSTVYFGVQWIAGSTDPEVRRLVDALLRVPVEDPPLWILLRDARELVRALQDGIARLERLAVLEQGGEA